MPQQIKFFRKSRCDYSFSYVSATASNTPGSAANTLQRSNRTGWGTTGSSDAENTTFQVNFGDAVTIDSILLIGHNWKNYKIQYLANDGVTWTDFNPVVNPTNSTDTTTLHSVPNTVTTALLVTIFGTQVPNAEKILNQFIATTLLGQLAGWPVINKPTLSRSLLAQPVISGKVNMAQQVGAFSCMLNVQVWSSDADLSLMETLKNATEGFLFWPCGGDQTQFLTVREGYRLQDIYLCRFKNEWTPQLYKGFYRSGMTIQTELVEVTN